MINSMLIAFKMYSNIPVKAVEWKAYNMRYSLCFVPVIGMFSALLLYVFWLVSEWLGLGSLLFGTVEVVILQMVSGGVHMNTFANTLNAVSSYRTKEKRIEYLHNSNIGSHAVIGIVYYILLEIGCFATIMQVETVALVGLACVLSRCMGGVMAVTMRNIRDGDSLEVLVKAANKPVVAGVLTGMIILVGVAGVLLDTLAGMFVILGMSLAAYYCIVMARKNFGGVSDDIIGFFIQVMELVGIIMAVTGELILKKL